MRHIFLTFFLLASAAGSAQYWSDSLLTGQAIKEDLMHLRSTIYNTHQDPFFYMDSSYFEQRFLLLEKELKDGASRQKFLMKVGELLQNLQDSHTYINYQALLGDIDKKGGHILPMKIHRIGAHFFVLEDLQGMFEYGTEIVSINEVPMKQLLGQMTNLSIFEGDSNEAHLRVAESIMPSLAGYVMDLKASNSIQFIPTDDDEIQITQYQAVTIAELKEIRKKSKVKNKPFTFEIDSNNIAFLTIKSFSLGGEGKYARYLKRSFRKIKSNDVRKVILDVRGNMGGSSERMEALFDYLQLNPSNVPSNIIARQSQLAMDRQAETYKGLTKWILNHFYKKNEDVQNYLKMVNMKPGTIDTLYYTAVREPARKRYRGDIYVLFDGLSGSATVNFISKFQEMELGETIGEPCLGPKGGTWGNPTSFKLPKSKISINISTIRFNTTNEFDNTPDEIVPNVISRMNPEDLRNGEDTQLKMAIEMAK